MSCSTLECLKKGKGNSIKLSISTGKRNELVVIGKIRYWPSLELTLLQGLGKRSMVFVPEVSFHV